MKKIVQITMFACLAASCVAPSDPSDTQDHPDDYTQSTIDELNSMPTPVVLAAKEQSWPGWNITLKDGAGKMHTFGNFSTLSNTIGETNQPGDTIR